MRGFKESIERTQAPLGTQSKRFDLIHQRANLTDASLSAMKQRDETLTPIERIQLQSKRNGIDSRRLAQKTRMDDKAWDKGLAREYGVKDWDETFIPEGEWSEYGRHGQGDQAGSSHQSDQTKKYDKDYASMTQEQRAVELVKKVFERYGNYDSNSAVREGTDIRAYIKNTNSKLDQNGYNAACTAILQQISDAASRDSIRCIIKKGYIQEEAYKKKYFRSQVD